MKQIVQAAGDTDLASYFASKLVGQPNAAEQIIPFIQTYKGGLSHVNRPIGVFLLLGPTGTGKTRTVEVLAEALHRNSQQYLRVDCGEFQLDHDVAKLIGAPPGFLGHRETIPVLSTQKLAATVTPECDISLVLIDEIEKAAPSLGQLLLGVLDKGRLTLGDGNVVNFENSLIFLTSNLGAREMMTEMLPSFGFEATTKPQRPWAGTASKLEAIALTAVRKKFSPEFVNRIDAVITYRPLSAESFEQILDHQIEELQRHVNNRLGQRCFSVELNASAREFLLSRGASVEYGARELKRAVYRYVTQPLATLVAENRIAPGSSVTVYAPAAQQNLDFEVREPASSASEAASSAVLLVDDNKSLLKFLKTVMSREGWDLSAAGSAKAALKLAQGSKFDIALIDYMLPDMDGAALALELKTILPALRIILMTGGGEMAFSQHSALADVPVVQKPFVIEDLLKLIRNRLPKGGRNKATAATSG
jgi:CheY-like chemotaxis protein